MQLIFAQAILAGCPTGSGWADGKLKVTVVVHSDVNIDGNDLAGLVGGLNSRGVVIKVHTIGAAVLKLSTNTVAAKGGLVDVVVHRSRFVEATEKAAFESMQIAWSAEKIVLMHQKIIHSNNKV